MRTLSLPLLLLALTACAPGADTGVGDPADAQPVVDAGGVIQIPGLDAGQSVDQGLEPDAMIVDASPPVDAEPPVDPCADWDGLRDQTLLRALHERLHDTYSPIPLRQRDNERYNTARYRMFTTVEFVERDGQMGQECVYTGEFFRQQEGIPPDDAVLNCEHIWPRSRMESDQSSRLYAHQQSDLHHLMPSVPGANNLRSSLPFGDVRSDADRSFSPSVEGRDSSGDRVFEPRDERKGDVARMVMYFATRWGKSINADEERALRAWHRADPVDARERRRNARVEQLQGNRNPFIDCPELPDRIRDFASFGILDREADLPEP